MSKGIYASIIGILFSMCATAQSPSSQIVSQLVILNVETGEEKIILQENRSAQLVAQWRVPNNKCWRIN